MAVIQRITDFIPNTLIVSQEVDDEFNQLVNILSGVSTNKDALIKYSHATDPVLRVDQLGAGAIQRWLQNGTERAKIGNDGALTITGPAAGSGNLIELFETSDATARTRISPDGKITTRAGNGATPSTDFLAAGGLYHFDFTTVGNVGGGEDNLMSKSVLANVLGADGDTLVVLATGSLANVAGNLILRAKYGGTNIDARTANGIGATANWRWALEISRNGGNVFCSSDIVIQNSGSDTTFHRWFNSATSFAVTHSNANTFVITGESANAANNDITQASLRIWKYSAP